MENKSSLFGRSKCQKVLLLFCLIIGFSCDPEDLPEYNVYGLEERTPLGDEDFLNQSSDVIFDHDSLYTYEIVIPEYLKNQIDAAPAAEEYVPAMLIFKGDTISPVGIRYKGSYGSFAGCLTGSGSSKIAGEKICTKLSMKIDVTYYQDKNKFYNLNKLQFHSMNTDKTQMHERLGYWLFRQMGVPAPRCVHVKVIINGEYSGLYALVEQVDEQFTDYHFDKGKGNLYKEVWPTNYRGKAYSRGFYLNHLKTAEPGKDEVVLMKDFGDDLEDSETNDLKSRLPNWLAIRQVLSYAVVDRTIRVDDGPFHWYEHNGRIYNHNYFWYEDPGQGKLFLIPYDLDNSFENIRIINNSIIAIADEWGETSSNCKPFEYFNSGKKQRSASCDLLCGGLMEFDSEYESLKQEFLNGPFSEGIIAPLLDAWEAQINSATQQASDLHYDAISEIVWNQQLQALKEDLDYARHK